MSYRRTPSGDPIPDQIPHSLVAECPDFRWWALALIAGCLIWSVAAWLIWLLVSSLLSLR